MDVELEEIRDFLAQCHPFDLLPNDVLDALPAKMSTGFAKRGSHPVEPGKTVDYLFILRSGSMETHAPDGTLLARLSKGEAFGIHALLNPGRSAKNTVIALEDSLLYQLPAAEFDRLRKDFPQFSYFFAPIGATRLRDAKTQGGTGDDQLSLMSERVSDMLTRPPITIERGRTIREVAQCMRDNRASCLLITENDKLCGIITDRDLRNRVVAEGIDLDTLVDDVMTANPIALQADSFAFDALLAMTRKNIRHLPIVKGEEIAGVITNTNLLRKETTSAVYLVGDIYKQTTFEGLAADVANIPQLLMNLVEAGGSAYKVGYITTSISDAVTSRLCDLAEQKFGAPPVPYVWCAAGSQARHEQTGVSDQDNCLVLSDDYDEAKHGDYFKQFCQFVSDGLDACGYVYCPGEMMATTDDWRQPLRVWKKYFSKWIDTPEPKALMLCSVFFDLRPIKGDQSLFDELQELIREKAPKNRIFIAHLVGNALTHAPPLGFFKNLVLIRGGEHDHRLDLKHSGVVPIVDLARLHALDAGETANNTEERLGSARESKALSQQGARDLLDAYEFIATTRLKHQARQIREGKKADNFVDPEKLSQFERSHLKDAFSVVKTIQSAMQSTMAPR